MLFPFTVPHTHLPLLSFALLHIFSFLPFFLFSKCLSPLFFLPLFFPSPCFSISFSSSFCLTFFSIFLITSVRLHLFFLPMQIFQHFSHRCCCKKRAKNLCVGQLPIPTPLLLEDITENCRHIHTLSRTRTRIPTLWVVQERSFIPQNKICFLGLTAHILSLHNKRRHTDSSKNLGYNLCSVLLRQTSYSETENFLSKQSEGDKNRRDPGSDISHVTATVT